MGDGVQCILIIKNICYRNIIVMHRMKSLMYSYILYSTLSSLVLFVASQDSCSFKTPCTLTGGLDSQLCNSYVSHKGILRVRLIVEVATFKFDWLQVSRRSYNGNQCPQTWRVLSGDIIEVTLVNKLTGQELNGNGTRIHPQDITNLYLHGLSINSKASGVDATRKIKPGESFTYEFQVAEDQAPGTYWFYPAVQGTSAIQVGGGMVGILIVEDIPKNSPVELNDISCPTNCLHDITILLSTQLMMKRYASVQIEVEDYLRINKTEAQHGQSAEEWMANYVNLITVNGQIKPLLLIARGQAKRIRFIHAGDHGSIEMEVLNDDQEKDERCKIQEIAKDGIYLDQPRSLGARQSLLFPGNRVDWLLRCDVPGKYKIVSKPRSTRDLHLAGFIRHVEHLATIEVIEFGLENSPFPKDLPKLPQKYDDLRNVKPDKILAIEAGPASVFNRESFMNAGDTLYVIKKESIVEMQLTNTNIDSGFSVHFRGNPVQVIKYEPYVGPLGLVDEGDNRNIVYFDQKTGNPCFYQYSSYKGYLPQPNTTYSLSYLGHDQRWLDDQQDSFGYMKNGEWRDTIFCPALANITVRMRIGPYYTPIIVQSTTTTQADEGMIMVINVTKSGINKNTKTPDLERALPGSCNRCDWNLMIPVRNDCNEQSEDDSKFTHYGVIIAAAMLILAAAYRYS